MSDVEEKVQTNIVADQDERTASLKLISGSNSQPMFEGLQPPKSPRQRSTTEHQASAKKIPRLQKLLPGIIFGAVLCATIGLGMCAKFDSYELASLRKYDAAEQALISELRKEIDTYKEKYDIKQNPPNQSDLHAGSRLINLYMNRHQLPQARHLLMELLALNPNERTWQADRVHLDRISGNYAAAISTAAQETSRAESDVFLAMLESGRTKDAIAFANKLIDGDALHHVDDKLAVMLLTGQKQRALEFIDGVSASALTGYTEGHPALVRLAIGDNAGAVQKFSQVIANGGDSRLLKYRAEAYEKLGNSVAAQKDRDAYEKTSKYNYYSDPSAILYDVQTECLRKYFYQKYPEFTSYLSTKWDLTP